MTQQKIIKYVATNDRGMRIGESHHNCKIKDCVVDRIREMHEDEGIGYRTIAKVLGLSRHTVRDICRYTRRAQTIEKWKKVVEVGAHAEPELVED